MPTHGVIERPDAVELRKHLVQDLDGEVLVCSATMGCVVAGGSGDGVRHGGQKFGGLRRTWSLYGQSI